MEFICKNNNQWNYSRNFLEYVIYFNISFKQMVNICWYIFVFLTIGKFWDVDNRDPIYLISWTLECSVTTYSLFFREFSRIETMYQCMMKRSSFIIFFILNIDFDHQKFLNCCAIHLALSALQCACLMAVTIFYTQIIT